MVIPTTVNGAEPISCWHVVASGKRKSLPEGLWEKAQGTEKAAKILRYLIENGLDYLSLRDACAGLSSLPEASSS